MIDYPHDYGHGDSTFYTVTSFKDKAGDTISKSTTITGTSKSARFDYAGDVDYYAFTPTASGTYTFTSSLTPSAFYVAFGISIGVPKELKFFRR